VNTRAYYIACVIPYVEEYMSVQPYRPSQSLPNEAIKGPVAWMMEIKEEEDKKLK
jgi:hypothetical protein